ncbi:MAG: ABC transporter ATP-binding protein [Nitrospinae bacterium]|nr:ABC transporter ATP-binding protein [Nitrospinota bacterium]
MTEALAIEGLGKSFGDMRAVDGISLTVREGEMFGIVGPDGAGKTTLFRMLCGIMKPSKGTARIFGHDVRGGMEQIKRQIGYFSQRFTLYGDLSVDENIEFFAEIHDVHDYRERREELLAFTRLTPFRGRLADRLSGGMKQKLALACTLIHRPRLIFLDEPTTGVDPISRMDFWKILSALLKTNITIVMSTPYLDEAERCGRVALMNRGAVMALDTPANIKERMRGDVLEIVCGDIRAAARLLKGAAGILDVQAFGDRLNVVVDGTEAGFKKVESILRNGGIPITDWRPVKPSLENVFISLITNAA